MGNFTTFQITPNKWNPKINTRITQIMRIKDFSGLFSFKTFKSLYAIILLNIIWKLKEKVFST